MFEVKIPFDFYHDGVTKTHYGKGLQNIPEDAAAVALREGWAVEAQPVEGKSEKKEKQVKEK